ncbi:MAG: winged helix-turn-helix transcriptional regulator [Candidatus Thermoplasmatota archaeon]|nr:winged helix-turn-helix transcriptional regulator [Candidatus Thermoplasmatota archaeon]MCL5989554.1 winged helix-turn-helix transcriptional regulator [Candidatus Thermoplasmatota archaeon]
MDRISDARELIISTVRSNPGIHFRELQRITSLANGQIQYHLYQMEKSGVISIRSDGKLKRYFLIESTGYDERKLILYLRSSNTRPLIFRLVTEKEIYIDKLLKNKKSQKAKAIDLLINEQIAGIKERGEKQYIYLKNPEQVISTIRKYKESFLDSLSMNLLSLLE